MPSQSALNDTTPVQTPSSEPTQPFRDTLVELSAGLAILGKAQCQQKSPSGIMEGGLIKKFDRLDLIEKTGISLPEILWAFALIFSPSRNGKHVVASVLREETQKQEPEKPLFTIYLAANSKECRETWTPTYNKKWENAVNHPTSTPLDFSSNLWRELTRTCIKRIKDYMKLAKKQFRGEKGKNTLQEIKTWLPSESSSEFAIELISLLEKIKETIENNPYNEGDLRSLVQDCWEITLSEKNKKKFEATYENLKCDSTHPTRPPSHKPLDRIQDLAKLPRAFKIFAKFQNILVLNEARLDIEEIPEITEHDHILPAVDGDHTNLIQKAINNLASQNPKVKRLEDLKALVGTRKTGHLHCEVKMLQHIDQCREEERVGIWNVIGCSKRPCYTCAKLIEASGFLYKESHGKAYYQQFGSVGGWLEGNPRMKEAIEELKVEVVTSVQRYSRSGDRPMTPVPDSPTLWSFNSFGRS
ncbi:hypothetical protein GGR58DRAFT_464698 [Xylaria digitata]|nr:hypothetical protein GGR58DRAFT_464698 [Xylaria digitata]